MWEEKHLTHGVGESFLMNITEEVLKGKWKFSNGENGRIVQVQGRTPAKAWKQENSVYREPQAIQCCCSKSPRQKAVNMER